MHEKQETIERVRAVLRDVQKYRGEQSSDSKRWRAIATMMEQIEKLDSVAIVGLARRALDVLAGVARPPMALVRTLQESIAAATRHNVNGSHGGPT